MRRWLAPSGSMGAALISAALGLGVGCKGREAAKPAAPAKVEAAPPKTEAAAPDAPSGLSDPAQTPDRPEPFEPPPGAQAKPLEEGTPDQLLALEAANKALARQDDAAALAAYIEAFDGPITGASISAGLAAAELQAQAGRIDETTATYERLLQMAPKVAEIRFTAGRFYSANGEPVKATAELRTAIELEPDFLPVYPLLGGVLASTGAAQRSAELMLTYETRLKLLLDTLVDPEMPAHRKVPIIDVFALVDDERATRGLIGAVADRSMHVRLAAAAALTYDADPAALEAIAKAAMAEEDPIARRALAASLKAAKKRFDASTRAPSPAMPPPRP